jgi:D-alanyl-lipoteichoic acid acyltransferase DltB (MBOAT superfamily)
MTADQVRDGLWLIGWGFFQKIFVADNLAPIASRVFAADAHLTGVNILLGTYAFAFQIYGDFAGYSNIARGTSKLMGIELIENFRFPTSCSRRRPSGGTGTSASRRGSAITSTSRSGAAGDRHG